MMRTLAVVWTLLILVGMSLPASTLPDLNLFSMDKALHLGAFAVLAFLWMSARSTPFFTRLRHVAMACILFGFLSEVYQGYLPFDRQADIFDALADTAGVAIGMVAFYLWHRRTRRHAPEAS